MVSPLQLVAGLPYSLFQTRQVSFGTKEIHSQPTTKGNGLTLLDSEKLAIRHHNYRSINQFISQGSPL